MLERLHMRKQSNPQCFQGRGGGRRRGGNNCGTGFGGGMGRRRKGRFGGDQRDYVDHDYYNHLKRNQVEQEWQAPAPPFADGNAQTIEDLCPLCKNHCPLSAPSCKKGEAYAASLG